MVATTAVTAALILVAGCGGSDKKSDSGSGNGGQSTTSATPSAPTVPSFDPPKALSVAAAFPSADYQGRSALDEAQMGIAGQVALVGGFAGLNGHDVANPNNQWMIPSKSADTTTVSGASKPMAAKVDGKDVAVVAYAEEDKGNGTQKPSGLILVQWIDVMTGKKIAEVSTPVSTLDGTGSDAIGSPKLTNTAYDPETGQVAVGVSTIGNSSVLSKTLAVFADPKTQKSTIMPAITPAAVHDGVIAGAKGSNDAKATDGTILLADGASGKVTKQLPLKQPVPTPLAGGAKHAYFYGSRYTDYDAGIAVSAIYALDLSTGAVVQTAPALPQKDVVGYDCIADQATSIVCTSNGNSGPEEILGLDDTTGKKTWGYTSLSGGRVVPQRVTAAYHGVVYAQTEAQPVLLDAKTGQDLPSAAPSSGGPSSSDTPSSGVTPSSGDSASTGDTPSESDSPSDNGDLGLTLYNGKQESPVAVSPFGGVYRQLPTGNDSSDLESVCIFVKATA
ncbi:hypothetical protein [Kribbella sp. NPDC049584]|uniref:hypothetical protein n=1 Tax=Kribbella sp. NPDC049584 TaxID=3154833 RepID=UPI0034409B5C